MSEGIERRRLRVYCAGPISTGDVFDNVVRGIRFGRQMVEDGLAPYIPHLDAYALGTCYPETNTHTMSWNSALEWDLEWVEASEAVFRLAGESKGADLEVQRAKDEGIPVFYEEPNHHQAGYTGLLRYARKHGLDGVRR
jgi:hypothetical protein